MKLTFLPHCAALALMLPGCAAISGGEETEEVRSQNPLDWRRLATVSDRRRIRGWRSAWMEGLAKARAAGHGAEIAREGALLNPDSTAALEAPPPGDYRCRTIKVGAKSAGMLDYIAYPPFTCRIRAEDGLLSLAKMSGSQRPIGLLVPDRSRRMIFLGTLQLGDERQALEYGRDRERDMIGALERVGPNRWRLAFPYPHFESVIDVLELVPRTSAN